MRVGIIGLGLMGGSLALSLKNMPFIREVIGSDHNKEHQKQALDLCLVKQIVEFQEIKKCDIIILSVPVNGIISIIQQLKDIPKNTTVIDFGGNSVIFQIADRIRKVIDLAETGKGR